MRDIDKIIVHCSATPPSMDIGVDEIRQWHQDRGWKNIGYHYVIRRNGTVERGRDEEEVGSHAKGYNENSIGICLVGGVNSKGKSDANFTYTQYRELYHLLFNMTIKKYPNAEILGHRDLPEVTKDCPCFNVAELIRATGPLT